MKEIRFDKLYVKFSNLYCEYRSRKNFLEWMKSAKEKNDDFVELTPSEGANFDIELSLKEARVIVPVVEKSIAELEMLMVGVLNGMKNMGQLDTAKAWHNDDWGNNFVEELCKTYGID